MIDELEVGHWRICRTIADEIIDIFTNLSHSSMNHSGRIPALELQEVSVRYGTVLALEGVSLLVSKGDQIAVVGPNGAGKSTLFNLIIGMADASSGCVKVYGSQPDGHICIGYVPQRNKIDWHFPVTVFDVVMMGRVGRIGLFRWAGRRDKHAVTSALESVGMANLAKRQIGELSGGQQQRVFLARALAQETHLLLLDEPLSGLDTPSQETLLSILDRLQEQGITMLVATHDLNRAVERFDKILLLNRRVIGFGDPREVLTTTNLATAYGSHLHISTNNNDADSGLNLGQDSIVIADTCCDHGPFPGGQSELSSHSH